MLLLCSLLSGKFIRYVWLNCLAAEVQASKTGRVPFKLGVYSSGGTRLLAGVNDRYFAGQTVSQYPHCEVTLTHKEGLVTCELFHKVVLMQPCLELFTNLQCIYLCLVSC